MTEPLLVRWNFFIRRVVSLSVAGRFRVANKRTVTAPIGAWVLGEARLAALVLTKPVFELWWKAAETFPTLYVTMKSDVEIERAYTEPHPFVP